MKSLLALFALLALTSAQKGTTDEVLKELRDVAEKCRKEHDVTYEQFKNFYIHNSPPSTKDQQCFVACTLREMKLIKNGVLDMEEMRKLNDRKFTSASEKHKGNALAQACADKLSSALSDECVYALEVVKCINEEKRNFYPDL